jgi:hypothetical protein
MKRPAIGRPHCCYCKRELAPANPPTPRSFTLDHVKALSLGGWKRVPCCRQCNLLKGDLHMDEWFWFISAFSRWWKVFDTPLQVAEKVREERVRRAWGRLRGEGLA